MVEGEAVSKLELVAIPMILSAIAFMGVGHRYNVSAGPNRRLN